MAEALPPASLASSEDERLVEALRRGDETAFVRLVEAYHPSLLRVARIYVRDRAVAEEVVQDAWIGVINGLDRFEGRSSLKTWIFRILENQARSRGEREARSIPLSSLVPAARDEPAVDPDRFNPPDAERWPGHWAMAPRSWDGVPEERLVARETLSLIEETLAGLPRLQRTVISLRDVEGWSAEEVCTLLGCSEVHQRVLLHRARSKVRATLERYLDEDGAT